MTKNEIVEEQVLAPDHCLNKRRCRGRTGMSFRNIARFYECIRES
jgi:hypothetical protein